jgi:L-asparaginase II
MTKDEITTLMNDAAGQHWGDEAHFQRFANMLLAAEREACAEECDAVSASADKAAVVGQYLIIRNGAEARRCAAAIRARRNK